MATDVVAEILRSDGSIEPVLGEVSEDGRTVTFQDGCTVRNGDILRFSPVVIEFD